MDAVANEPDEFDAVTIRENRNGTQREYDGLLIRNQPNQYNIYNVERQRNQCIRKNDPNYTVTRTQWPGYNPSRDYNEFSRGVCTSSERFSDGRISDGQSPINTTIDRMKKEIEKQLRREYVPWIDEALRRRDGLTCRVCWGTFNTYDELIEHEMSRHSCDDPYRPGYPKP